MTRTLRPFEMLWRRFDVTIRQCAGAPPSDWQDFHHIIRGARVDVRRPLRKGDGTYLVGLRWAREGSGGARAVSGGYASLIVTRDPYDSRPHLKHP